MLQMNVVNLETFVCAVVAVALQQMNYATASTEVILQLIPKS